MTRAKFFQRIAAPFAALPLFARRKKPNVWDSTSGQYCLMLRAELERLGHFDDLKEDWMSVEEALGRGHQLFGAFASRTVDTKDGRKMLFSVRPMDIRKASVDLSFGPFNYLTFSRMKEEDSF